jgi:hypothetical protein
MESTEERLNHAFIIMVKKTAEALLSMMTISISGFVWTASFLVGLFIFTHKTNLDNCIRDTLDDVSPDIVKQQHALQADFERFGFFWITILITAVNSFAAAVLLILFVYFHQFNKTRAAEKLIVFYGILCCSICILSGMVIPSFNTRATEYARLVCPNPVNVAIQILSNFGPFAVVLFRAGLLFYYDSKARTIILGKVKEKGGKLVRFLLELAGLGAATIVTFFVFRTLPEDITSLTSVSTLSLDIPDVVLPVAITLMAVPVLNLFIMGVVTFILDDAVVEDDLVFFLLAFLTEFANVTQAVCCGILIAFAFSATIHYQFQQTTASGDKYRLFLASCSCVIAFVVLVKFIFRSFIDQNELIEEAKPQKKKRKQVV